MNEDTYEILRGQLVLAEVTGAKAIAVEPEVLRDLLAAWRRTTDADEDREWDSFG